MGVVGRSKLQQFFSGDGGSGEESWCVKLYKGWSVSVKKE